MSRAVPILVGLSLAAALRAQPLEPVLRAELAFARMAEEKGIRPAFLAWLREDARVFTPRMTSAKARYGPEPGDGGHLAWYPEAMGLAASGELAWSFGPWTYAGKKGDPPRVHGHFLSVWRRGADGRWKVGADIGVPHAAPTRPIEPFAPWDGPPARKGFAKAPDPTPTLRQLEAELAGGASLAPRLAAGARILRPGRISSGPEAVQVLAAEGPGPRWEPAVVEAAASGDLAWSCGETAPGAGAASFLRIWVLEAGAWKALFDVRLPHPIPK